MRYSTDRWALRIGSARNLFDEALTRRFGAASPRLPVNDLATIALPTGWLQKYAGRYLGRNGMVELEIKDGALVARAGNTIVPIRFVSPDELVVAGAQGDAISYRHISASTLAPAHVECWIGENSLDYNDGPLDAPGPDMPAWTPYLGTYRLERWGKPAEVMVAQRKNGYLYLNDTRLVAEHEPGLFFTSDGEAVDFRHDPPTWRNVRMNRS